MIPTNQSCRHSNSAVRFVVVLGLSTFLLPSDLLIYAGLLLFIRYTCPIYLRGLKILQKDRVIKNNRKTKHVQSFGIPLIHLPGFMAMT